MCLCKPPCIYHMFISTLCWIQYLTFTLVVKVAVQLTSAHLCNKVIECNKISGVKM